MDRVAVAGMIVLAVLLGASACSGSDGSKKALRTDSSSPGAQCSKATAQASTRAEIAESGIEPSCVKVRKGGDFTLLNSDAKAHDFTTTESSPVQLQVDLEKGAAFPYTFEKSGTYTLTEASSDLALTIIVD
jgi:plastocyanin